MRLEGVHGVARREVSDAHGVLVVSVAVHDVVALEDALLVTWGSCGSGNRCVKVVASQRLLQPLLTMGEILYSRKSG